MFTHRLDIAGLLGTLGDETAQAWLAKIRA
jgi:hypothetical protein